MSTALIGYSGFVGQTLLRAASFDHLYRSTNIQDITGHSFDLVVCAGAPAQKWLANKEPAADARSIDSLMDCLRTIQASRFVLVSTVDVFGKPVCVDETCAVETEGLHPYGFNRWRLEQFVRSTFAEALIIRLPGLVGHGLKKNILFDFLNEPLQALGLIRFCFQIGLYLRDGGFQRFLLFLVGQGQGGVALVR